MTELTDLSETDASNTTITLINIDEGCAPSGMNNAVRNTLGLIRRAFKTTIFRLRDSTDQTKLLAYDLSPLTTATTRTQIVPDENGRQALAAHLSGHLYGLTLSNNVTDATNDIDIAAGVAIDSTNAHVMTLASALTKRLDAAWAVGTGNGGLDTGAIANTTYHVWLIKRVDTGVVDALFSTSASAPTMPANYTLKRRIGSFLRVSAAIKAFSQVGDEFLYTVPAADYASTTLGTTRENIAISTPAGIVVTALMRVVMTNAAITHVKISAQGETDTINSATGDTSIVNSVAGIITAGHFSIRAGTNSQITARASNANTDLRIATYGYIDRRGQNA